MCASGRDSDVAYEIRVMLHAPVRVSAIHSTPLCAVGKSYRLAAVCWCTLLH